MSDEDAYAAQLLSSLLETTRDSVEGYRQAAALARNPRFREAFAERAARRDQLTEALSREIRTFGGQPPARGSLIGPAHLELMVLRDRMGGGTSDRPLIEEVERGETFIHGRFETAAGDAGLPAPARATLADACRAIAEDHAAVSALAAEFH